MGLLDDLPTEQQARQAAELAAPMLEAFLGAAGEKSRSFVEAMASGLSPADIIGLKGKHIDALVAQGLGLLKAGEAAKAKEFLAMTAMLEPMDGRAAYGLGVIAFQEGDLKTAAHQFLHFVALDATNPDGHLRLSECFMANREYEQAEERAEAARRLAEAGHGDAAQIAHAERLAALARERRTG